MELKFWQNNEHFHHILIMVSINYNILILGVLFNVGTKHETEKTLGSL